MKLSEKVVALRKAKGMSQEGLAEKLNVSRQPAFWKMFFLDFLVLFNFQLLLSALNLAIGKK